MASNFHHQGLQCISLVLQYFWRSVPDPTSQAGSKLKLLQRLFYSSWYLQAETSSPCASTCFLRIHDKIQNFHVKSLEIISVISYKAWGSWWRVATSCTYIALYGAFVRVMDKTLTPQSLDYPYGPPALKHGLHHWSLFISVRKLRESSFRSIFPVMILVKPDSLGFLTSFNHYKMSVALKSPF